MLFAAAKIAASACIIAFVSWLAGKRPDLAGFLTALPLVTLLALPLSYAEYSDSETSVRYAQSIFAAIPLTLLFFVPFLFAGKLGIGFWPLYGMGFAMLTGGYFLHKAVMAQL